MRRLLVMMTGVAAALLVGCADKNAETTDNPGAATTNYDTTGGGAYTATSGAYNTTGGGYATSGNPYGGGATYTNTTTADPYAAGNYSTPTSGGGGYTGATSGGGGQTYTTQRGDTFYKLARQFYGDQARWRDIYNANSGQVADPNRLPAGITIIIP